MKRSKLVKPTREWGGENVRVHIETQDECLVSLVKGGPKRAYVWIGRKDGGFVTTIEGEKVLRELARAILREIGPVRNRNRKQVPRGRSR